MSIIERLAQDSARKAEAGQRKQTKSQLQAELAFWRIVNAEVRGDEIDDTPNAVHAMCNVLGIEIGKIEEAVDLIRSAVRMDEKFSADAVAEQKRVHREQARELSAEAQRLEAQAKEIREELGRKRAAANQHADAARLGQQRLGNTVDSLVRLGVLLEPGTFSADLERRVADAMPSEVDPRFTVAQIRQQAERAQERASAEAHSQQVKASNAERWRASHGVGE